MAEHRLERFFEERGLVLVLTAPSGSGKTTVIRELCARRPRFHHSVSATTRPRRAQEVEGRDYYFLSEPEFEEKVRRGEFTEWAEVHGHRYGTLRREIEGNLAEGRHVVMDVDVQGSRSIRRLYPQGVFIFLLPPSLTVMRGRLEGRGTEDPASLERRLRNAVSEIEALAESDFVVVNRQLEEAVRELEAIILAETRQVSRLTQPHRLVETFLDSGLEER